MELKRVTVEEFTISASREFQGFTTRLQKKCFEVASEFVSFKFVTLASSSGIV